MAEEMMTKAAAMRGDGQMTMIHRIALAIDKAAGTYSEDVSCWYDHARAALGAMREPTPEMVEAAKPWPGHWGSFEDADPVRKVAYWADQAAAASGFTTMIDAALSEADHG